MSKIYINPEHIINEIWQAGRISGQVYALVDAAQDEQIYPTLVKSNDKYCCLYEGGIPKALAETAPYLVKLEKSFQLTRWLISYGWGKNWAIYLDSLATLEELRRHFRKFLLVQTEQKKELYFRFYDPRVLRIYLPTCNEAELAAIFGPINRFCLEDGDHTRIMEYTRTALKLLPNVIYAKIAD